MASIVIRGDQQSVITGTHLDSLPSRYFVSGNDVPCTPANYHSARFAVRGLRRVSRQRGVAVWASEDGVSLRISLQGSRLASRCAGHRLLDCVERTTNETGYCNGCESALDI